MTEVRLGDIVVVTSSNARGVVRYSDTTEFAPGHWIGVELEAAGGKNDGSVNGKRYFQSKPGHGMFVREANITLVERPVAKARPSVNGTAKKPRPPSGLAAADPTKKRQSVAPSPSTGSRLSLRVSCY